MSDEMPVKYMPHQGTPICGHATSIGQFPSREEACYSLPLNGTMYLGGYTDFGCDKCNTSREKEIIEWATKMDKEKE